MVRVDPSAGSEAIPAPRRAGQPSGRADTHCPYCALQCGIALRPAGGTVTLAPLSDFPVNQGGLCSKGWTAGELLDHPDRLRTPLVRTDPGDRRSPLRPAGWAEALDLVAGAIGRTRARYGPDAVGCFGGGGLTNEKAYQLGKFARVALGTARIDYNGRFCMSSAAAAGGLAFGIDRGLPFPLADVAGAEAVLLVGGNPAETMPPAMRFFDAGRAAGVRHVVVDPRATPTARRADLHLQPTPGTDLALANGLLHVAIRDGFVDDDNVAARWPGRPGQHVPGRNRTFLERAALGQGGRGAICGRSRAFRPPVARGCPLLPPDARQLPGNRPSRPAGWP